MVRYKLAKKYYIQTYDLVIPYTAKKNKDGTMTVLRGRIQEQSINCQNLND